MRSIPFRMTSPWLGGSKPEIKFRSVVLPQPDGPTTATNSRGRMSSDKFRITSTGPKDRETESRRSEPLLLIAPPDARNSGELHKEPVQKHSDRPDHNHVDYQ